MIGCLLRAWGQALNRQSRYRLLTGTLTAEKTGQGNTCIFCTKLRRLWCLGELGAGALRGARPLDRGAACPLLGLRPPRCPVGVVGSSAGHTETRGLGRLPCSCSPSSGLVAHGVLSAEKAFPSLSRCHRRRFSQDLSVTAALTAREGEASAQRSPWGVALTAPRTAGILAHVASPCPGSASSSKCLFFP